MRKPSKQTLSIIAVVLLCLWGSFLLYIGWAMRQPPEKFGRVMSRMPMPAFFLFPFETMWTKARAGTVQPGEMAPDFKSADAGPPVRSATFFIARQAGSAGVRQLHVTAVPAGGSCPQQTV